MKIDMRKYKELENGKVLSEMETIFKKLATGNSHYGYFNPQKNSLVIKSVYMEVTYYQILKVICDKGVFCLIKMETSDIGIANNHIPDISFSVAGFDKTAAITETEAIRFLISEIMNFFENKNFTPTDRAVIRGKLQKKLLPNT